MSSPVRSGTKNTGKGGATAWRLSSPSLSRNVWLDEQRELRERLLPAEIAGFDRNHRRQVRLLDVDFSSDRNRFQRDGDLDDAGKIGIVKPVGVADTLVGHDLEIFSAERMACVGGEIRK